MKNEEIKTIKLLQKLMNREALKLVAQPKLPTQEQIAKAGGRVYCVK